MTKKKVINEVRKGRDRHWKNFIDRDYLGGHNLERDEEMILTIKKVEGEEEVVNHTDSSKSKKIVLYFEENVPKMILNITNAATLESLYGRHIEDWEGEKIQLTTVLVKAFGKNHDALRIRDVVPSMITAKSAVIALNESKDLNELKRTWDSLGVKIRTQKTVIAAKEKLKNKLK